MIPRRVCGLLFFLVLAVSVSAQSNQFIDELLLEEQVSFGSAVHLVLNAVELISEEASVEEALQVLVEQEWEIKVKEPLEPILLGEYALLIMTSLDIPGGLMYSLSPGPRYACRELDYLGFIYERPLSYRKLSGDEALQILGGVLEWKQDQDAEEAEV
jgi:hypothetical protein